MEATPPAKKAKPSSPRSDAVGEEDRLSALDDDALREILSRLPLRDAAATTALSRRYPRVFATLPRLRLDSTTFNARASLDIDYCDDNNRWVDDLDCVLAGRQAPVVAFEVDVDVDFLEGYEDWFYSFDAVIARKRPDGNKVQELFDFKEMQKREHKVTDEATNVVTFLGGVGCAKELSLSMSHKVSKVLSKTSNSVPIMLPKKCYLHGLQKLFLSLDYNDGHLAKVVSCLLNSSPNLHDLEIYDSYNDRPASSVAPESWEKQASTECAQKLSNVILYMSSQSIKKCCYMGFSKFLLMRMKALKRLSIKYQLFKDEQDLYTAELERARGELQQWPTACPGAAVGFSAVDRLPWF